MPLADTPLTGSPGLPICADLASLEVVQTRSYNKV